MNHTVSDFIIRFKNATRARKREFSTPYANISKGIAELLTKEGFLTKVKEQEVNGKRTLTCEIAYDNRQPVLTDVEIVTKPSLRVYQRAKRISPTETKGIITSILSTSQGILSGKEAKEKGIGGELLFKIW